MLEEKYKEPVRAGGVRVPANSLCSSSSSGRVAGDHRRAAAPTDVYTGRKWAFSPGSQRPLVPAVQPELNMRD